jgi:hypothetical protein
MARERREIYPYTTTPTTTTEEPYLAITVSWDLTYIDFPICLARVLVYFQLLGPARLDLHESGTIG